MRNREILMGFLLLIITLSLFIIANNYDKKEALKNKEEEKTVGDEDLNNSPTIPKYYDSNRIIIVGDSRMYAASKVVQKEGLTFIAKNAVTCNYLWETVEPEVDKLIAENPEEHFTIVFNLGVNDLNSIEVGNTPDGKHICDYSQYADYYKYFKKKWNQHNLFFASVNPVNEEILRTGKFKTRKMTNNGSIEEFNQNIRGEIESEEIFFCNTYAFLLENGFESPDGLHYSDNTSKNIIENIESCNKEVREELLSQNLSYFPSFKEINKEIL